MRNRNSQQIRLDQRLTGYSAGAKRLRGRIGNWPIYAAAAGSALAMTTNASASIISGVYAGTGINLGPNGGFAVQPGLHGTTSVQGLSFGIGSIHIKAGSGSSANGPFAGLSVAANGPVRIFQSHPFPNSLNAERFAAGAAISSGAPGTLAASNARIVAGFFTGNHFGNFVTGQPGYVGFAYNLGGNNYDYGWLKVDFVNVGDMPHILEALAWGVNLTQNQAIAAGETTSPSPEPGTMGLAILAAGAAGVVALRRRRQAKASAA